MTTFPIVSSVSPRPTGDYLVFRGNADVAKATLIRTERVLSSTPRRPVAWREEGTGIYSLGPFNHNTIGRTA